MHLSFDLQLRNLVWATSSNDVYVVHENAVNHWNPFTRRLTEVGHLGYLMAVFACVFDL
jgi:hypothetical protein